VVCRLHYVRVLAEEGDASWQSRVGTTGQGLLLYSLISPASFSHPPFARLPPVRCSTFSVLRTLPTGQNTTISLTQRNSTSQQNPKSSFVHLYSLSVLFLSSFTIFDSILHISVPSLSLRSRLREEFLNNTFSNAGVLSEQGFDLLSRLLSFNPKKRITAAEALSHPWFKESPLPQKISMMPTFTSAHNSNK
jgi:serine/threonine protein kinase